MTDQTARETFVSIRTPSTAANGADGKRWTAAIAAARTYHRRVRRLLIGSRRLPLRRSGRKDETGRNAPFKKVANGSCFLKASARGASICRNSSR